MDEPAPLLERIAQGDRRALEEAYRAHKDALLSTAYHLLGERTDAEDVLQDTFVRLARGAGELRLRGGLRAWLVWTCVNGCRDRLRKRARERVSDDELGALASSDGGPQARAESSDEADRVSRALALLPDAQREVVVLHVHGELTFREVAELLSISINTAQSRYRYALGALETRLARQGAER